MFVGDMCESELGRDHTRKTGLTGVREGCLDSGNSTGERDRKRSNQRRGAESLTKTQRANWASIGRRRTRRSVWKEALDGQDDRAHIGIGEGRGLTSVL